MDAYFGVRRENTRYLTGFELAAGEEAVAGVSGQFLVSADETVVLADSRYRVQAREQCPEVAHRGRLQRPARPLAGIARQPAARSAVAVTARVAPGRAGGAAS